MEFIEALSLFMPLFMAIIAFVAILTGFSIVFRLLITPIKKDIEIVKKEISRLEAGQAELKQLIQAQKS